MKKNLYSCAWLLCLAPGFCFSEEPSIPILGKASEVARFVAPEARQGVAVDKAYLYVIGNHVIGKYDKKTFVKIDHWECEEGEPLIHLNAGLVLDDRLITAHSNYPEVPMLSSIEVFDPATLDHTDNFSFGMQAGSLTWVARREGQWFGFFAHYGNRAAEPDRDPSWSQLIRFDPNWQRLEGWALPKALLALTGKYSASGGAFGPGGKLYVTGHDGPFLYILDFPAGGSRLELLGRIPIEAEGQAFAFDPDDPTLFYSVLKKEREVIVERLELNAEVLP